MNLPGSVATPDYHDAQLWGYPRPIPDLLVTYSIGYSDGIVCGTAVFRGGVTIDLLSWNENAKDLADSWLNAWGRPDMHDKLSDWHVTTAAARTCTHPE